MGFKSEGPQGLDGGALGQQRWRYDLGRLLVEPRLVLNATQLAVGRRCILPDSCGQQMRRLGALQKRDVADVVDQLRVL